MVIHFKRNNQTYIDVCARRDEGSKETEADWEPAAAAQAPAAPPGLPSRLQ